MQDTIRVFVPVGHERTEQSHRASSPRERSRSHLVIGLLDNHKHNTDRILARLEQRLSERYEAVEFVHSKKPEAGKPIPAALLESLATRCDAVVNGIGD